MILPPNYNLFISHTLNICQQSSYILTMTSTLGSRCFITTDIPAINPPPPIGTTTASK